MRSLEARIEALERELSRIPIRPFEGSTPPAQVTPFVVKQIGDPGTISNNKAYWRSGCANSNNAPVTCKPAILLQDTGRYIDPNPHDDSSEVHVWLDAFAGVVFTGQVLFAQQVQIKEDGYSPDITDDYRTYDNYVTAPSRSSTTPVIRWMAIGGQSNVLFTRCYYHAGGAPYFELNYTGGYTARAVERGLSPSCEHYDTQQTIPIFTWEISRFEPCTFNDGDQAIIGFDQTLVQFGNPWFVIGKAGKSCYSSSSSGSSSSFSWSSGSSSSGSSSSASSSSSSSSSSNSSSSSSSSSSSASSRSDSSGSSSTSCNPIGCYYTPISSSGSPTGWTWYFGSSTCYEGSGCTSCPDVDAAFIALHGYPTSGGQSLFVGCVPP